MTCRGNIGIHVLIGSQMRIKLSIAIGACYHISHGNAQYQYPGCGPCIPMMPCPCMTGMPTMQVPQMVMPATAMIVQAVPQPIPAKPCDSTTSSVSASTGTVTPSNSLSTGDISSIISQIIKAELTGTWTQLMQTIDQFNSRSESKSVTHNYYSQYNHADISQWSVFIQSLIEKIQQQGVQSDQDRENLADLRRLLDHPPSTLPADGDLPVRVTPPLLALGGGASSPTQPRPLLPIGGVGPARITHSLLALGNGASGLAPSPLLPTLPFGRVRLAPNPPSEVPAIEVSAPRPSPNSPMAYIAPLAIGWQPKETDLIPQFASKIQRQLDPRNNPLVEYIADMLGRVCQDNTACLSGADKMAKLLVALNEFTKGTGTVGLPRREFIGGDWISVGGSAAADPYIQLLRDGLTKFHNTFCLRGARPRCDQVKPELVQFLTSMLGEKADVAENVRSFVLISLTNGFHALNWRRILDGKAVIGDKLAGAEAAAKPVVPDALGTDLTPATPVRPDASTPAGSKDLAKAIEGILSSTPPIAEDGNNVGSVSSDKEKAEINEMIRQLVLLPGSGGNAIDRLSRLADKPPIMVTREVFDTIMKQMKKLAGVDVGADQLGVGGADVVSREVQQDQRNQGIVARLIGQNGAGSSAGESSAIAPSSTTTDIVVASLPAKKESNGNKDWTTVYKYVPQLESGDEGESQGSLKMLKQPVLDFAPELAQYMVQGVRLNLNRDGAGVGAVGDDQQLVIYGQGEVVGENQSVADAGERIDQDKVFTLDAENASLLYEKLKSVFHNTLCEAVGGINRKECRSASNTMANVMAYVDTLTESKGASSLAHPSVGPIINLLGLSTDDVQWKKTVGESLTRIAATYCPDNRESCERGMKKVARFLEFVTLTKNAEYREFVKRVLWDGMAGFTGVEDRGVTKQAGQGVSRVERVADNSGDSVVVLPASGQSKRSTERLAFEDGSARTTSMFDQFQLTLRGEKKV